MTTVNRTTQPTSHAGDETATGRRGLGWRRLLVIASVVALASFLVPMLIEGSVEGFFVAMSAPFLVGLLLLRWRPRAGAAWLGVVALAELLMSAPFLVDALTHPEVPSDFLPLVAFTLSTLVAAVAAVPAFRLGSRPDTRASGAVTTAVLAGGVLAVSVVVSAATALNVDSSVAQEGDLLLAAEDFRFDQARLTATTEPVSVAVTNDDSTRHTFTVDELGVDVSLPPGTTQRVTFEADAGTYRFYCRPHPEMSGELTVQ